MWYHYAEKVKNDFVCDDDVAAALGPEYDLPCSQLTYEADNRNANKTDS